MSATAKLKGAVRGRIVCGIDRGRVRILLRQVHAFGSHGKCTEDAEIPEGAEVKFPTSPTISASSETSASSEINRTVARAQSIACSIRPRLQTCLTNNPRIASR